MSHVVLDGGELVGFTLQPLNPPPSEGRFLYRLWSQSQFGCGVAGENSIPLKSSPSYPVVQVARVNVMQINVYYHCSFVL